MTDNSKPIDLNAQEGITEQRTTPLGDAFRQFKRNRLAIVGFFIILAFFFMAITANIWTSFGVLDHSRGFRATHTINPVGWETTDFFADPGTCARDNIGQGEPWCAVLDSETRARFPIQCVEQIPDIDQRQWCYVLGGGEQGKDIMTQTIYGAQVSLAVAVIGASVSLLAGIVYGVTAGYYGGRVDNIMMRIIDFLYGIPILVIIILLQVFFRGIAREYDDAGGLIGTIVDINKDLGGLLFLFFALGLLSWIGMARLARGQVLSYREKEFVEAARAVGASDRRIIFVHLLPNIIGPLIVVEALAVPGYVFTEAFLSFIGLGVQPGTPSWGQMISDVQSQGGLTSNQHLVIVPGLALVILTLAFNFFGDGLRDALDPRLRGQG
jgi:oligopeptide transport system permease protein